jgi:hypothetical protein
MHSRLVYLLHIFLAVLLFSAAAPAAANTLVLGDQILARLTVVIEGSDSISTSSDIVNLTPFTGAAETTPQGILNPELVVSSIVLDLPETAASLSFGAAAIPALLTLSAHYQWEPNDSVPMIASARPLTPPPESREVWVFVFTPGAGDVGSPPGSQ